MGTLTLRFFVASLLVTVVACGGSTDLFSDGTATTTSGEGGSTSGGTGGSTSGTGGGGECDGPQDCAVPQSECMEATCGGGTCGETNSPPGTPCSTGACDGAGNCLGENGAPCVAGAECASGNCVDEVCCDGLCDGLCEACDGAGSEGTCTPMAAGTDPDSECGAGVCDGSGACAVGDHLWSKRFGDSATQYAFRMAVDTAGNSAITGYFGGTVDFGGGPLTSAGGYDAYVAKFTPSGDHIWSKRFGDSSSQLGQFGWGVALDATGHTYLTGYFYGTINFGGTTLTATSERDIFLAKFSPSGDHLWSKSFPGSANSSEWCRAITVDGNGDIYLGGWFENSVDFGGGWLTSVNGWDTFIAKFTASGNYVASARYGGTDNQQIYAMAVDSANNLLVTGYFYGTVDFGSGSGLLTSNGDRDMLVAKFSPTGTTLWAKSYGAAGEQRGRSIAVDGADNVIIGGYFEDNVDFGGGTVQNNGGFDAVVLKIDGAGNHLWSKAIGSSTNQLSEGVATDGNGNVFLAGQTVSGMDFGGGLLGNPGSNSTEAFLVKLSAGGVHLWSKLFDGSFVQSSQAVGVDGAGNSYLTGYYQSGINLGGSPMTSMGSYDIFLGKFAP
ncbi:MAG: hypothetical protein DRI90_13630 [Deltaproteobacteria bacterium]|nr:MAG: hypothetical protein DRI90_13630 [Deltaproteobacteria bacterium]